MADQETDALAADIARNAASYDALPYTSIPFSITHPARMAAVAHLFGLDAPALDDMRVLELGCAAGGNIIPLANRCPNAQFVGLDISEKQVQQARERINRLGLKNISIQCRSITDRDPDIGTFDYIICHGVYSWVPEAVREGIFSLCHDTLSPNGIIYVSYNVYPGWHVYEPLRDACRLLIPESYDATLRVRMLRDLLDFMPAHTPDKGLYRDLLRDAQSRLKNREDYYLFHEYIENTNEPCSFSEFIGTANRHGLSYLAEADIQSMLAELHGQEFAEGVRQRVANDIVSYEQMLDIMTGRPFRQTLLVHGSRARQINRRLSAERIRHLHLTPSRGLTCRPEGKRLTFCDRHDRKFDTELAVMGRVGELLSRSSPGSFAFDECIEGLDKPMQAAVSNALFKMVGIGMLLPSTTSFQTARPSARPKASTLARKDVAEGLNLTASLLHDPVQVDPAAVAVLPMLDGSRDQEQVLEVLVEASRQGAFVLQQGGRMITDDEKLRAAARELLPQILEGIANAGLLEA